MVAKDHKPQFVRKVDPFDGPIEVKLEKLNLEELGPKRVLHGRVIDSEGKPIPKATVDFEMYGSDGWGQGGRVEGVDPLTVTDDQGEFWLTAQRPFDWITVTVDAPVFAKRRFFKLASGKQHELKLTEGATVKGRVLRKGKPLKSVEVGLASADRAMSNFLGDFRIGTDGDGRFQFLNMPPYHVYQFYGCSESFKGLGALPVRKVHVGADGSTKDLGDLEVESGFRLMGRVVLSDGGQTPAKTRVVLTREDAWDSTAVEAAPDGSFEFADIPAGQVNLSAKIPGYRLSDKNKSLDRLNGFSIMGRIDQDVAGLILLLEPGQFVQPDFEELRKLNIDLRPKDKQLRGAESVNLQAGG